MPYSPPGAGYPGSPIAPGWVVPAPPPPRPRGIPNRSLFLVGAVGHFVAAGMAIPFALFSLGFGFGFFFGFFSIFALASAVMMSVGLVIQLIGFYGFWRNYGSRLGLATFAYGLAATAVFLAATATETFNRNPFFVYIAAAGFVTIGVMFILDGAAFIVIRNYTNPGASIAAGVLHIIAGGFVCSLLFAVVGGILAMPALIIGGIVLVSAPVPVLYAPRAAYGPAEPQPPFPP